jgi:hypothetical protein
LNWLKMEEKHMWKPIAAMALPLVMLAGAQVAPASAGRGQATATPDVRHTATPVAQQSPPVDEVIQRYIQALGGAPALDRISSRRVETKGAEKATCTWQAPNRVLRVRGAVREGYDGKVGWLETKRKRVQKLPHSVQDEMETDANPVRYARLHDLFTDLNSGPQQSIEGTLMDVIVAPNHIGNTKLFFNASTHLLARIEEFGLTSAYFKHVTDFSDYKEVDGIRIPTRISRESDEPGAENGETRLTKIEQNIEVNSTLFERPNVAGTVLGGK